MDKNHLVPLVSRLVIQPDKKEDPIAIIVEDEHISYSMLAEKIYSAASKLIDMGVSRGDRVLLSASSTPSFIFGYFATHLLGAITVPIDPHTPESRIEYIADKISPRAIFLHHGNGMKFPSSHSIEMLDCKEMNGRVRNVSKLNDPADILFTTGTTGDPKGVVLTHKNIVTAANNINEFIKNTSDDREVVPLPLSHSFGLGRLRCILLAGGTIILNRGFTFPGEIFLEIEKYKATGLSFVPAGLAILVRFTGQKIGDYSEQLRYIEIGSAPMPLEHKILLSDLLPRTRICMHYGLTESSRSSFIEFHESRHKLHSIGRPSPNVELKIVDEDGNELPPNQKGRILVRGGMVLKEYWQNESITRESFQNGWFCTGDFGYTDEEGYFYLDGREKEIINVGGLKVSPVEVECILCRYDGVIDCACVGMPDPMGITGETVKACLVAKKESKRRPSPSDIKNFLKDKLEPYKIPTVYEWVERIPKTFSGKVQRRLLVNKNSIQTNH